MNYHEDTHRVLFPFRFIASFLFLFFSSHFSIPTRYLVTGVLKEAYEHKHLNSISCSNSGTMCIWRGWLWGLGYFDGMEGISGWFGVDLKDGRDGLGWMDGAGNVPALVSLPWNLQEYTPVSHIPSLFFVV